MINQISSYPSSESNSLKLALSSFSQFSQKHISEQLKPFLQQTHRRLSHFALHRHSDKLIIDSGAGGRVVIIGT